MPSKRYILDKEDLQFRQFSLETREIILRFFLFIAVSGLLALFYGFIFVKIFGSPKKELLSQDLEQLKFKYNMLDKKVSRSMMLVADLADSDAKRYRPILNMSEVPATFREPGVGGVIRNRDMEGYANSELMVNLAGRLELLKQQAQFQAKSYDDLVLKTSAWKREMEHLPYIRPVHVSITLGDGLKFRDVHPVLGISRWHYGQDFDAPPGTEVFATGAGVVIDAGWNAHGFGNVVKIDHGYGFQTIYGHLSSISVTAGQKVSRGEMLGLSGSTGISSGPHLHYEINFNGVHQNPLYYFTDDMTPEEYSSMIEALQGTDK